MQHFVAIFKVHVLISAGRSILWCVWLNFTGPMCSSMACKLNKIKFSDKKIRDEFYIIIHFKFWWLILFLLANILISKRYYIIDLMRWVCFVHRFDNMNAEKLQIAARQSGVEMDLFYFDPKMINWEDYFMNIHIPGIVKYSFKWN